MTDDREYRLFFRVSVDNLGIFSVRTHVISIQTSVGTVFAQMSSRGLERYCRFCDKPHDRPPLPWRDVILPKYIVVLTDY